MRYWSGVLGACFMTLGALGAQNPPANPHDFGTANAGEGRDASRVCIICHTPAVESTGSATARSMVWAGTDADVDFQLYPGLQRDGQGKATSTRLDLICVSCHDGTQVKGDSRSPQDGRLRSNALFGGVTGRGGHPVMVVYDARRTEHLRAPASYFANGKSIADFLDESSRVRCWTCHDPHPAQGTRRVYPSLLRVPVKDSALCVRCHKM